MTIDQHVDVTIVVSNAGIARAGFGLAGHLSYKSLWPERLRLYNRLSDVIADGFVASSPEALFAAQQFAQSPHPTQVAILRGTLPPTQRYSMSVASVLNNHLYELKVKGEGVTATTVSYTSDGTATDAEIAAGLVAALNAVVGNNYLAAGAASPFTATADAAGNWFSIESVNPTEISIIQNHADPGIATDLAAIQLANPNWYALHTAFNSYAMVLAAAAWVEAETKEYIVSVNDSLSITAAPGGSDILDDLAALNYKRTVGAYHPSPAQMFDAAWEGRLLPLNPGAWTAAYKTLSGVEATIFTATQIANLDGKRASYYKSEAGRSITWEGKVGSTTYGFLDVTVALDFVLDDIQKSVFGILVSLDKVAYTDEDIAIIRGAVEGAVDRAKSDLYKIVAPGTPGDPNDPEPTVSFPKVADIDPSTRALRQLPDGVVNFRLQGAVHKVFIDLTVTF